MAIFSWQFELSQVSWTWKNKVFTKLSLKIWACLKSIETRCIEHSVIPGREEHRYTRKKNLPILPHIAFWNFFLFPKLKEIIKGTILKVWRLSRESYLQIWGHPRRNPPAESTTHYWWRAAICQRINPSWSTWKFHFTSFCFETRSWNVNNDMGLIFLWPHVWLFPSLFLSLSSQRFSQPHNITKCYSVQNLRKNIIIYIYNFFLFLKRVILPHEKCIYWNEKKYSS